MMQWMRLIGDVVKHKNSLVWISILFAVASLWFLLPRVGLSSYKWHIALVLSLLMIIILVNLVRVYLNRRRGANLEQAMSQVNDKNFARQMELDALKTQMQAAITALKKSSLGSRYSRKSLLYVLPWYILIGPSAAGKTTLLRNSGLDFPMANEDEIKVRGFGGTRNCDWWFASEGVVLDTAGRYTTEPDDRKEWLGFLSILKKYRKRQPINGVIIAFSLLDLLTLNEAELMQHAKLIRDRITELYQDLGFVVPCYFIITKFDLLKGFVDYYADLTDEQRTSVFGAVIGSQSERSLVEQLQQGLQQIYQSLIRARDGKLALQRKSLNKFSIYDFPEQFKACWPRLRQFFSVLSKINPYQQQPMLAGLYFTSGTQEGMPIAQLTNKLSQAFGLAEPEDQGCQANQKFKQYFIHDLFKHIIVGQYEIARPIVKNIKRQHSIKFCIIFLSLALISTLLVDGYSHSRFEYKRLITSISLADTVMKQYTDAHSKRLTRLDALSSFFSFYQTLQLQQKDSVKSHLFSSGTNKGFISVYKEIFNRIMIMEFLLPVKRQLLNRLANQYYLWQQTQSHNLYQRGAYVTTLQAFMLLSLPQYMRYQDSVPQLAHLWLKHINDDKSPEMVIGDSLPQSMVQAFLTYFQANPRSLNSFNMSVTTSELIKPVQQQLADQPLATNLYGLIYYQGLKKLNWQSLDKFNRYYNLAYLQSNYKIPALFTRQAWSDYVAPYIHELTSGNYGSWLLTTPITDVTIVTDNVARYNHKNGLINQIKQAYFHDYSRSWQQFLKSIYIEQPNTLAQATDMMKAVSDNNGTMHALLQLINNNFTLDDQQFSRFRIAPINNHQIKDYLNSLRQVQIRLQQIANAPDPAAECLQLVEAILAGRGANKAFLKSSLMVDRILQQPNIKPHKRLWRHILLMPIVASWQTVLYNAGISLEQKWQQHIYTAYAQGLQGRFPFARSSDDADISDVINLLSPGQGMLAQFYQQNLMPLIDTDKQPWVAKTWLGYGIKFSKDYLVQIRTMLDLGRLLFKSKGNDLNLGFQVYPIPTPGLTSIILESNGQRLNYHNGPQEWYRYTWPGDWQNGDTVLIINRMHDSCVANITNKGLWGLFHLLSKAKLIMHSRSEVRATWRMQCGGRRYPVNLSFKFDSQANLAELLKFNRLLPRIIIARKTQ